MKEETGVDIPFQKRDPILSIKYFSKNYPSIDENTLFISNYYVIYYDLNEDLDNTNLTEDEKDGHFELRKISTNDILKILEDSLDTCTKVNVVKDTIKAIKEYLRNFS